MNTFSSLYQDFLQAKEELKQLACQLADARREISLLKAERDFLREQNIGLRNQALAAKKWCIFFFPCPLFFFLRSIHRSTPLFHVNLEMKY